MMRRLYQELAAWKMHREILPVSLPYIDPRTCRNCPIVARNIETLHSYFGSVLQRIAEHLHAGTAIWRGSAHGISSATTTQTPMTLFDIKVNLFQLDLKTL
jgi:hypothetical protein